MGATLSTLLAVFTLITFGQQPVNAQKRCEIVDLSYDGGPAFDIYAGDTFDDDQFGPATITGETQGSRVNARSTPGGDHDGAYGLVGDPVEILGFGYGPNCALWWKTRFPGSGYVGWIHDDYIQTQYGRGLWD
ncbi:MAG: SH3 domain-containing protein [Cyanobacteria bacterium P01_C01_bin.118]